MEAEKNLTKERDYRIYRMTPGDLLKTFGASAVITGIIALLFYDRIWGILVFPAVFVLMYRRIRKECQEKRQKMLKAQFVDATKAIVTSLLAGISLENAWREAEKEIGMLYGKEAIFCRELCEMNRSVEMNVPLEQLLEEFAERSGVEDIASFAEVFSFAKRSGGDFVGILERAAGHMRQKQEIEQEIEVMIAAKKMEQRVMEVIPVGMLAYLRVASGGYLDVLYGNAAGILFMSGCLGVYALAMALSKRIMEIEV